MKEALSQPELRAGRPKDLPPIVDWKYEMATGLFTFTDRCYALNGTTAEVEGGNELTTEAFIRRFVHPQDVDLISEEIAKASATTNPHYVSEIEMRTLRRDGEVRQILVYIAVIKDAEGRTTHMCGVNHDITDRKRTENELRNLWSAVEQTPSTVVITNSEGKIEYANPKFTEVTGYNLAEALGKNPRILKSNHHPRSFYESMWNTLLRGNVWQGEILNKKKNGELYWESASISPVRNPKNEITHFIAIKEDITARKRATEELKEAQTALVESQRFLQSALNALSAHIAILDESGCIIAVNEAWNQFANRNSFLGNDFGLGANYLELCDSAVGACVTEAPDVAAGIRSVMAGRCDEFQLEYPCHSPQEQKWFLVRITRFSGTGPIRTVVAHENITARKRVEEELQWKTAFLEAQVNSSINGLLVVDHQGRKTLQNQRLIELLRMPPEIVADPDVSSLIRWGVETTDNSEEYIKKISYLYSHPDFVSRDQVELKDGIVLDRYSAPLIGTNGKNFGRVFIFLDITDQTRAAQQLKLSKEAAESANRAKSEFLAAMSHEIRTPMNGLLGFTNLLNETTLTSEQKHYVETIQLSGNSLLALINDILDFSKIEAGKMTLESIRFSPAQILGEVGELFAVQLKQKKLAFETQNDLLLPATIFGDPGRVRQVLLNLVGNAMKFTKKGNITTELKVDPSLPDFVRFEISDTGIGIAPEKQSLLFKKFSQVDSSTTRLFGGTGLGLAIAKRLVELMGGNIGFTSESGKGSTFWFTIPAGQPPAELATAHSVFVQNTVQDDPPIYSMPQAETEPLFQVLLVEDDITNQRLLTRMLQKLSCNIELANNGIEAVTLAGQKDYDLIFMDCLMPEMDGWEATFQIRKAENGKKHVPIIAATASVMDEQRKRCYVVGMDDFLEKPIKEQALQSILLKWAPTRSK